MQLWCYFHIQGLLYFLNACFWNQMSRKDMSVSLSYYSPYLPLRNQWSIPLPTSTPQRSVDNSIQFIQIWSNDHAKSRFTFTYENAFTLMHSATTTKKCRTARILYGIANQSTGRIGDNENARHSNTKLHIEWYSCTLNATRAKSQHMMVVCSKGCNAS